MGRLTNEEILFTGPNVYFMDDRVVLREFICVNDESIPSFSVYSVEFKGARHVVPIGDEPTGTISNFFVGPRELWVTGLQSYSTLIYRNLYDGIDLKYTIKEEGLKYEFLLRPGSDLTDIKMVFHGADLSTNGQELFIELKGKTLIDGSFYVYQNINGLKKQLPASIYVNRNTVSYDVDYDPDHELVIDPLIFSTFLGGSMDEWPSSFAFDDNGEIYLYGMVDSLNFPTTPGSYSPSYNGFHDNFISKFNSDASQLLISTYFGGSTVEYSGELFIDPDGNIVAIGSTQSDDYPTTTSFNGVTFQDNVNFYSKFDPSLSTLMISAFYLDPDHGEVFKTRMDEDGDLWITGYTESDSLPKTRDAYQSSRAGYRDAFLLELGKNLSGLKYGTYLGGAGSDTGVELSLLNDHEICIAGTTDSMDYPTEENSFDTTFGGGLDLFLTVLNISSANLRYSTYIGGSDFETVREIWFENSSNVTVYGSSESIDLPVTLNAYDNTKPGGFDPFVMNLDLSTNCPNYSTYIGSTQNDFPTNMFIHEGNVHVVGRTIDSSYPVTDGAYDTSISGGDDMYYSILSGDGSRLLYSTFIGGSSMEFPADMYIDRNGDLILTGDTRSSNFPITSQASQIAFGGASDAFLMKLCIADSPATPISVKTHSGDSFVNISWREGNAIFVEDFVVYKGNDVTNLERYQMVGSCKYFNDTNVSNGIEYVYQITALNDVGESSPTAAIRTTPGGPPSEPWYLNCTGKKNLVILEWSPPNSTRGFPVTGYIIYKAQNGMEISRYMSLENTTRFEDSFVENGRTYRYGVKAENARGIGPISSTFEALPGAVPEAISKISITEGDSSISLKWNVPDGCGFEIEEYKIFRGEEMDELDEIGRSDTNTYTDNSVINGVMYFYSVSAVNHLGESIGNVVGSGSPSSVPGKVEATIVSGDRYVMVHWSEPTDNGGRPILEYRIYSGTDPEDLEYFDTTTGHECNITGLENGVECYVAVSAANENGEGPFSELLTSLPCSIPDYPVSLSVVQTEGSILLGWEEPLDMGGLDILGYVVFKGTAENDMVEIAETMDNTFLDSDFEWGEEYFYSVSAVNEMGPGVCSPILSIKPLTVPDAPLSGIVYVGYSFIHLHWEEPAFMGGTEKVRYKVYRIEDDESISFLTEIPNLDFNDTYLMENSTYRYRITSVNEKGEGQEYLEMTGKTLKRDIPDNDDPVDDDKDSKENDEDGTNSVLFVMIVVVAASLMIGLVFLIMGVVLLNRKSARPELLMPPPNMIKPGIPLSPPHKGGIDGTEAMNDMFDRP
ncbi:MAG: fibronectin type III domain-containing protein [Thermoplasmatota archaeon]